MREGKNDDKSTIRGQLTLMMERFCQGARSDSIARLEQCREESYGKFIRRCSKLNFKSLRAGISIEYTNEEITLSK